MLDQQQAAPGSIATRDLPIYVPLEILLSSERASWSGILVQRCLQAPLDLVLPGITDHLIAVQMGRAINLACKLAGRCSQGRVNPGDITILPKGIPTEWHLDGTADVLHLHLQPALVAQIAVEAVDIDPARVDIVDRFTIRDPLIQQIGLALLSELQSGGVLGRLYAESLAHTLTIHLIRNHSALAQSAPAINGGLTQHQLRCVLEYIHAHLDQDIALADLATVVHVSPYHFTRLFKQSIGQSPHQYLIGQRVELAKQLLTDPDLTIAGVAALVGFANQSHLTRHFKRLTGVLPKTVLLQRKNVQKDRTNMADT